MRFRVLGPLEVRVNDAEVDIGGGKRRTLLAVLLMHANEVVPVDRLVDDLWGEHPPATAVKAVQVYVAQLRRSLGDARADRIRTYPHGYLLQTGEGERDVDALESALAAAESAMADGRPADAGTVLREALGLWRGPPYADFGSEHFAQAEIARLEDLHAVLVEKRIEADLALGRHADVVGELEALVADEPLREGTRMLLMTALYRCGRTAEALQVYREGRRALVDELGIEPGAKLRELEQSILEQTAPVGHEPPTADKAAEPSPPTRRSGVAVAIPLGAAMLLLAAILAALAEIRSERPGGDAAHIGLTRSVLALQAQSGALERHIAVAGEPTALSRDGSMVWSASTGSAAVVAIDTRANAVVRVVPLRIKPAAMVAGSRAVWVADGQQGLLVRISKRAREATRVTEIRQVPLAGDAAGERPVSLALARDGVWVADGSASITGVDDTGRVLTRLRLGRRVDAVAVAGGSLWAITTRGALLLRIDVDKERISAVVETEPRTEATGPLPADIVTSGDALWLLNRDSRRVTRVDTRSGRLVAGATLPVGSDPTAITASDAAAWVVGDGGAVTRIDGAGGAHEVSRLDVALRDVVVEGERLWVAAGPVAASSDHPDG